jgi:hypothetical protein
VWLPRVAGQGMLSSHSMEREESEWSCREWVGEFRFREHVDSSLVFAATFSWCGCETLGSHTPPRRAPSEFFAENQWRQHPRVPHTPLCYTRS